MTNRQQYTILAVDDEPFNLDALKRTFRKSYKVLTTTSPDEALQLFTSRDIHLVIADQRMPGMTGTELLSRMRQTSPLPIRIVLSAYTDIEYLIDAINRGEVYRYITKPWEPQELQIAVKNALAHYQANIDRLNLIDKLKKANQRLGNKNRQLKTALSELKQAQDKLIEMERLSVIGKMASMIIHDLKQPLDIIRSAADTLVRSDLEPGERNDISDMIRSEVNHFLEMIHELLEYSRGTFRLEPVPMLLSDFWAFSENRLGHALRNKNAEIHFSAPRQDAMLRIDHQRFQRVFLNLFNNALEACASYKVDHPRIILQAEVVGNSVIFQVDDNGPGISPEIGEKIFTPFVSGKKQGGIGLGLAIVKHIVEEHGGSIHYQPLSDGGSRFIITLPAL